MLILDPVPFDPSCAHALWLNATASTSHRPDDLTDMGHSLAFGIGTIDTLGGRPS
jgi:hypothetical protein